MIVKPEQDLNIFRLLMQDFNSYFQKEVEKRMFPKYYLNAAVIYWRPRLSSDRIPFQLIQCIEINCRGFFCCYFVLFGILSDYHILLKIVNKQ